MAQLSDDWVMMDDVLTGLQPMDLSHAGGEFEAVTQQIGDDLLSSRNPRSVF